MMTVEKHVKTPPPGILGIIEEACKLRQELARATAKEPGERAPKEVFLELDAVLSKVTEELPGSRHFPLKWI